MTTKPQKTIALVDAGKNPEIINAILPFLPSHYDFIQTEDYNADYVFTPALATMC